MSEEYLPPPPIPPKRIGLPSDRNLMPSVMDIILPPPPDFEDKEPPQQHLVSSAEPPALPPKRMVHHVKNNLLQTLDNKVSVDPNVNRNLLSVCSNGSARHTHFYSSYLETDLDSFELNNNHNHNHNHNDRNQVPSITNGHRKENSHEDSTSTRTTNNNSMQNSDEKDEDSSDEDDYQLLEKCLTMGRRSIAIASKPKHNRLSTSTSILEALESNQIVNQNAMNVNEQEEDDYQILEKCLTLGRKSSSVKAMPIRPKSIPRATQV